MSTESTFDYGDDEQPGHMMTKKQFDKVNKHMFKAQREQKHKRKEKEREGVNYSQAKEEEHMSYDLIDRFLRNNLDDDDYKEYLAALDELMNPNNPNRMTRLDELWDALAAYQSIADDKGHGDTWAEMCRLRTVEACRAAEYAAADAAEYWMQEAIKRINKAIELAEKND